MQAWQRCARCERRTNRENGLCKHCMLRRAGASALRGLKEKDYSADELEFMRALDAYKREQQRPFPTCCEVLEVVKSLGYRKEQKEGEG